MIDPGQAPLLNMLRATENRVRMHMPGHKGRLSLDSAWDTTELPCTDDLFAPQGGIARAEKALARSAGAASSLLLSGGGTAGVLAMILSMIPPGGKLIVPRDCHLSVLSACVWGDIQPVFVWPRLHTASGLSYVDAGDVAQTVRAHPDARAVLVTRPDYRGVCMDLAQVAHAAKSAGMWLLVDEAHGAHFNWPIDGQPKGAGTLGAHLWMQSAHKTLPALTGGAWLHLHDDQLTARVRGVLRLVHTSSPSFPILASLDAARAWMDAHGTAALTALHESIAAFWRGLKEGGSALRNTHALLEDGNTDPARVVIDTSQQGYTGQEISDWLSVRGIDVEMADGRHVVLIPTVWDQKDALERVGEALLSLPQKPSLLMEGRTAPPVEVVMRLREAALSVHVKLLPLERAEGEIAACCAGVYPPGIPLIVPGERVTAEVMRALSDAKHCFGVENGALRCVINH